MKPLWSFVVAFVVVAPSAAHALDKQGSAHGGSLAGDASGVGVSGSLLLGSALYNQSYAARPDNTGLALFRYAGHADIDLIGTRLSIPLDVNMFTDRLADGWGKVVPTELDLIAGVTSTWPVGPAAVEIGSRIENDRALDHDGVQQTYVDVRARGLFSLAAVAPGVADALAGGDVSGAATWGVFAYNPSYYARPDNTGRALFRYALHTEMSFWDKRAGLGIDATFFTDREQNPLRPSELDFTAEVIVRGLGLDLHVAYERDMPLDDHGAMPDYVQSFLYATIGFGFSAG